jgi:hypothetical protein
MDTPLPSLLTAHDVADWLGQSAAWVLRRARRGQIPCLKLPSGEFLFDQRELIGWLDSLRQREGQPCRA